MKLPPATACARRSTNCSRILEPGSETVPHLLITTEQVQFNPASDHWVDVLEFKTRLSACQSHHPAGLSLCAGCLDSLQRTIALYQGELLDGLTLPRCTHFTDWQILTQEACHARRWLPSPNWQTTSKPIMPMTSSSPAPRGRSSWNPGASRPTGARCGRWRRAGSVSGRCSSTRHCEKSCSASWGSPQWTQTRQLYEQIRNRASPRHHHPGMERPGSLLPRRINPCENAAGTCSLSSGSSSWRNCRAF